MSRKVAVVGAGMTRFVRRAKESPNELTAHAVQMALDDAGMTIDEIDCVVMGTAPDAFDGVHMKGDHLIPGAGGTNKPYMRHFVGGGTGVFSPIHGWMHIASGKFDTCLVIAEEKMSPCTPHPAGAFLTIFDRVTEQPLELTLIHIFAIEMARFMHVYGYTEEEIARISVMNKRTALNHPAAQVAENITVADVMNSTLLSWPVKRLDISPTSDGAVAVVLTNERIARAKKPAPVFIEGVGYRLDTAYWATRDLAFPNYVAMAARDAYQMAGITNPARDIDIFEPYDPFDYKALHHMNGLLLDKTGRTVRELFDAGAFESDGTHPMCPSGGAMGVGNPIAATGLMKIAELYFQLTGQAGKRQVKKTVRRGVAQAWGDLMQVGTVVVMGADGAPPTFKSAWNARTAKDLPGTAVKANAKLPIIEDDPYLEYAWDNGLAMTTYLEGLKAGKLRGSLDRRTNRMMIPPRAFSEIANLDPVADYFDIPDSGTVMTYTISYVNWDSSPLPDGQVKIFAVIAIDGCDEHMGLVHRLDDVAPADVKIGMRVRAVWKDAADREGKITDITHFAPEGRRKKAPSGFLAAKPAEMTVMRAGATKGKIPLAYRYTAGVAGTEFYDGLAKGKIVGSATPEGPLVPPASFDEDTMEPLAGGTVDVTGTGRILSFAVVTEDRAGKQLAEPAVIVQVGFAGAHGSVFGFLSVGEGQEFGNGSEVTFVKPKKMSGPASVIFQLAGKKKTKKS
ncbi:thiolase domain-containing protein [bacterium]|nr:thiolase domain-containing protein [bacterium]